MFGILLSVITLYIFWQLWINANIGLNWKIILTVVAIAGRFFWMGIPGLIATIIVIILLRWNGINIK